MARPVKCRKIGCDPEFRLFKPAGVPATLLETVDLSFDEFEAIRLADFEGLYQEAAAQQMHVSRQTFGNIIASARHKVSQMLVSGKQLTVTGGTIMVTSEERVFKCATCSHKWSVAYGAARPAACPSCGGVNIHRLSSDGSFGGGRHGAGKCRGLRTGLNREVLGDGSGAGKRDGQGAGAGQGQGRAQGSGRGMGQGRGLGQRCCDSQGHVHSHEGDQNNIQTVEGENR
ncbi:DUF134 domain-containing protein [Chlorobium phaeobacteroides]|uniref:UPF0251 protein Cpha266_1458 n=1 Tax=Chlorobium phaeobacteroides (strain DSM 266 / SMG 266 / 2430) TaxID=290317 RepID=A1BGF9_CHLPD|nr:DUF134 domain-containing protein [Chlorobium phaeobacteroides]ABL65486.1 protein of unknown function DUF134 [Chlorobium phaeobacteroides DSM 266]